MISKLTHQFLRKVSIVPKSKIFIRLTEPLPAAEAWFGCPWQHSPGTTSTIWKRKANRRRCKSCTSGRKKESGASCGSHIRKRRVKKLPPKFTRELVFPLWERCANLTGSATYVPSTCSFFSTLKSPTCFFTSSTFASAWFSCCFPC